MKKFISWNVNGLRAVLKKGFLENFTRLDADVFCLQEIKMQKDQLDLPLEGYHQFYNYAEKKGYSGTALFSKEKPLSVTYGINKEEHDQEGRVITADFGSYFLVTVYTPNAQDGLKRLDYRMDWENCFRSYLQELAKQKAVFVCGDLNVAHKEIDLEHPKANRQNPGFSDEEREKFSTLLDTGFVDTYRHFYPDKAKAYSWWSYRSKARERNVGWRIDYFLCDQKGLISIKEAKIHDQIFGSDHCPVELVIDEKLL